jgi:HD-GYP domain-containing protein (c-di-GMP phosphodiesterase class II)
MAALVLRHHERLDGSGYHRKVGASDLSLAARILAAAESFQTAREERPHRKASSDEAAASTLRTDVRAGSLCPVAAEAVLSVAGQPSRRAPPRPLSGMTPREIEVLRLIAAGLTAKETAQKLDISPKTADHHIQSIYGKIGVTTRAAAALYAVERGVLKAGETPS